MGWSRGGHSAELLWILLTPFSYPSTGRYGENALNTFFSQIKDQGTIWIGNGPCRPDRGKIQFKADDVCVRCYNPE